MSDFAELLQEAEKLTGELDGTSELPKVDRSLRQVLEASNELYTRVAQTGAKDIQANLLLGSKGIDLPRIVQKLENISTKRTVEPIERLDDYDINTFLENEIRNCILNVIDDEHKKCLDSIYDEAWEHELGDWKQEKRKILNAMTAPSGAFLDLSKPTSMFLDSSLNLGPTLLGSQESAYVDVLTEYNKALVKGNKKPNLVTLFATAAEAFKDTKVNDIWEMTKYMVELPPFPSSEDAIRTRNTQLVIKALIHEAKKYLEDRYKTYMVSVVNENLYRAARGGVPGTYPLVRSYVGIRLQGEYLGLQDGTIDDRPLWPMVYYCLRSGDISAALHCLKQTSLDCNDLISLLEMKFNNPDSLEIVKLESNIKFQYRRFIRNITDPFKRIVWAVLGCCDVSDEHSEVAKTADDYLWLKLNFVRHVSDKEDSIQYEQLQRTILEEYGEAHYDAMNHPHLYFQVLILTGQFEAAIEFLARTERYRVHIVHIAIALHEMYMLGGCRDPSAPLISCDPLDPKPNRRLNIARLIMLYVHKFEITCPAEAMQYFYLLRNMTNSDGVNLFTVSVSDMAQETCEYEKLFGKIQGNGIRTRGLVDEFISGDITTDKIAEVVADQLVKKGSFEDAIDLYDIANNQEEVLSLLCTLLSQVVHLQNTEGSLRERLQVKVNEMASRYTRIGHKCTTNIWMSFTVLGNLLVFFDQYHTKQYNLALKTLSDLEIVPLQNSELDEKVNNFKRLNVDVCKIFPDVLLATMNMLFSQYQKIKDNEYIPSRYQDATVDQQLAIMRDKAKVLTNFTGMLPYRMPGDTNSKLVQMEILMH